MDVWRDIVLFLIVLAIFSFGFFLMTKLDRVLGENRKAMEKETESCEPSCVLLTKSFTDEEIIEEIQKFRSIHKEAFVVLYDSSVTEVSENLDRQMRKSIKK